MEKKNEYSLYRHISPNGKMYFGITKQNPENRWERGSGYRTNEYFTRAIKKYGWDNFKHQVIVSGLSKEEACSLEIASIAFYHTNDYRYGYNHSTGGDNTFSGSYKDLREGNSPRARRISQYTKDGYFIREWSASTEVQRVLGIDYSCVIKCCSGKSKYAAGYVWLYSEEVTDANVKERCEKAKHRYNSPFTDEHREHMSIGIRKHYENKLKERN